MKNRVLVDRPSPSQFRGFVNSPLMRCANLLLRNRYIAVLRFYFLKHTHYCHDRLACANLALRASGCWSEALIPNA